MYNNHPYLELCRVCAQVPVGAFRLLQRTLSIAQVAELLVEVHIGSAQLYTKGW